MLSTFNARTLAHASWHAKRTGGAGGSSVLTDTLYVTENENGEEESGTSVESALVSLAAWTNRSSPSLVDVDSASLDSRALARVTQKVSSALFPHAVSRGLVDHAGDGDLNSNSDISHLLGLTPRISANHSKPVRLLVSQILAYHHACSPATAIADACSSAACLLDSLFESPFNSASAQLTLSLLALQYLAVRVVWIITFHAINDTSINRETLQRVRALLNRVHDHLCIQEKVAPSNPRKLIRLKSGVTTIPNDLIWADLRHLTCAFALSLDDFHGTQQPSTIPTALETLQMIVVQKSHISTLVWTLALHHLPRNPGTARSHLEHLLTLHTTTEPPAYLLNTLACAYMRLGQCDLAALCLRSIPNPGPALEALYNRALLARRIFCVAEERSALVAFVRSVLDAWERVPQGRVPSLAAVLHAVLWLATALAPGEAAAMLSRVFFLWPGDAPQPLRRALALAFFDASVRRRGRGIARALVQAKDGAGCVLVLRFAVFGKGGGSGSVGEEEGKWGSVDPEVNVGEESYSVKEAREVAVEYLRRVESSGASKEGWKNEALHEILIEMHANLSLLEHALGRPREALHHSAQAHALSAAGTSPLALHVAHNHALLLHRASGDTRAATHVWIHARLPGLAGVLEVARLGPLFWRRVAERVVGGETVGKAFVGVLEGCGESVLMGVWSVGSGFASGAKQQEAGWRYMDLVTLKQLCHEGM
ncbi:hypothetical protein BC830DRAFT_1173924 [Chytriomyces sp. MP71]|nr:hypothetical protein BC830DRAFT_1173924 [Chytriomyces sp. MP71]